jgi:hypothetical protein
MVVDHHDASSLPVAADRKPIHDRQTRDHRREKKKLDRNERRRGRMTGAIVASCAEKMAGAARRTPRQKPK